MMTEKIQSLQIRYMFVGEDAHQAMATADVATDGQMLELWIALDLIMCEWLTEGGVGPW